MIKGFFIGITVNILFFIIFILIYFNTNFFVMNNHYYKLKYQEDYQAYNNLFEDEFGIIMDFYFKLNLVKHRNGPTKRVLLSFRDELTRFDNLAPEVMNSYAQDRTED